MKSKVITKEEAYALLRKAGQREVLPYRGYATALSDTSRLGMNPAGELVLIENDKQQGQAYSDQRGI